MPVLSTGSREELLYSCSTSSSACVTFLPHAGSLHRYYKRASAWLAIMTCVLCGELDVNAWWRLSDRKMKGDKIVKRVATCNILPDRQPREMARSD